MIARLQLLSWLTTVIFAALFSVQATAGDVNKKDQTGLRQGYWIITGEMLGDRTYAAGAKVEEGYYKDDRRHGVWKKYYPTGKLRSEITYNIGRPKDLISSTIPMAILKKRVTGMMEKTLANSSVFSKTENHNNSSFLMKVASAMAPNIIITTMEILL